MATIPITKYAKSGDVHLAYQVVGEGSLDLVLVPGWVSHLEYAWEEPSFAGFLRRLASFSRLILLDRRGTGLSDPVHELPTLEQRMDDVRAVMDAVGSKRAALFGISESGPMAMLFAATYPSRTSALVLYGTYARFLQASDYPIGLPPEALGKFLELVGDSWGTGSMSADYFAPSRAHDELFRQSWARFERLAVSPAGIKTLLSMLHQTDARHVLPVIRVLATVMFTDIVGATEQAVELGDRRWRDLLDRHHAVIREQLIRFRGREIDTAGDGFLAAFDGPARGIRCAGEVVREVHRLGLEIRAGLHTGECEILGDKLSGVAVHTGARVASLAGAGEVLVSSTVKDLVAGSGITFLDRGAHMLKGLPGEWRVYAVASA